MRKGQFTLLSLLLMTVLVFTACAPKAIAPPPVADVTVPKAQTREAWEVEWEKLTANGKREGKVMLYATEISPMLRTSLTKTAKEKFGLALEVISGRSAEVTMKILSERRAGIYLADVFIGGSTDTITRLKPAAALASLDAVIMLPEVLNPEVWYLGGLRFIDKDHTVLAFLSYPSPSIAINTNLVKREEIQSYRDLLQPRWKGKMTMQDPTTPGTGSKWVRVLGTGVGGKPIMGLDFVRELVRQEPVITVNSRLQVEWLAQGKYPIALAPTSAPLAEFSEAGAPIQLLTPEEGLYLTAGVGNVSLFDKAPHLNAAGVFINWLLTREGQTLFSRYNLVQSGRVDVPTDHLPPAKTRDPKVKYIFGDTEEFLLKGPEDYQLFREIFAPLLK